MRTARNPVIGGSHPDPSVCRVGEDYYLVCSSFEYFPGVPIFHSRDLVSWRQVGNVLKRPDQLRPAAGTPTSRGIHQPTIRHHGGRFWVAATDLSAGGTFVVTTDRLAGRWSEPVWIDLPGVVPDLAWDENGDCWCVTTDGRTARIDPYRGTVLEGPWPTWSGGDAPNPKTPHLYHVGDWWYLLFERGQSLTVSRARTPRGPFEPAPSTLVDIAGPTRGSGRADLVTTPDGAWWLVRPGTREHPSGFHVLGQEVFLTPVRWRDEWPEVVGVAETAPLPAEPRVPPTQFARDDFDEFVLAPSWISPRGLPDGSWSLTERPGWLTLRATGDTLDRPGCTFVGSRLRHLDSRVSVRLDPGTARAGLSIRRDEAHRYDFEVVPGRVDVVARIGPVRQVVASRTRPPGPITLTVITRTTDLVPPSFVRPTDDHAGVEPAGPDTIAFHVDDDAGPLAELDGRYLSPEVTASLAGRVVGMYVTRGVAAFDWFDYRGFN
ncbi:family 43 glycosylhydrolase [Actinosynnema sp. CA-299493]